MKKQNVEVLRAGSQGHKARRRLKQTNKKTSEGKLGG